MKLSGRVLLAAVAVAVSMSAVTAGAQSLSESRQKAIDEEAKQTAKELTKKGWDPLVGTASLEYSLKRYLTYVEENGDNVIAITGMAVGKNNREGRIAATSAGVSRYASESAARLMEQLKAKAANGGGLSAADIEKFGEIYEAALSERIKAVAREHFAIGRKLSGGSKEYKVYISVKEEKARRAREEACRIAMAQTGIEGIGE